MFLASQNKEKIILLSRAVNANRKFIGEVKELVLLLEKKTDILSDQVIALTRLSEEKEGD